MLRIPADTADRVHRAGDDEPAEREQGLRLDHPPHVRPADDRAPHQGEISAVVQTVQSLGTFAIFEFFSILKNDLLLFFIKLIWLGVGFLNRTGAEIGQ